MSRFNNLEFQNGPDQESRLSQEGPRDEAHYLAEAQRAYARADFEQGLRHFARALEENPKSAAAWTGQVRMLTELKEYREAKAWADKALEHLPNHPELLAAKAVALGRLGDLDEAMALSDAAFEERGTSPYLWLARADVLLARGEARADYCLEKAVGLAPRDWFFAWLAARVRKFYKQTAAALKLLQQAVAWDAGQFVVWLDLAKCQAELGCFAVARDSYRQAIDINPACNEAHAGLNGLQRMGFLDRLGGAWRRLTGS